MTYGLGNRAKELRFDSGCDGRVVSKQIPCRQFYVLMGLHKKLHDLYVFCTSIFVFFLTIYILYSVVTNAAFRLSKMDSDN